MGNLSRSLQKMRLDGEMARWKILSTITHYPKLEIRPKDILLFVVTRNERIRLPHLIQYYQTLGVDWIVLLDNESDDGTENITEEFQHVVHLVAPGSFYLNPWWHKAALDHYAKNHWSLVADSDEYIVYPNMEKVNLHRLSEYLEKEGSTALYGKLLDMFSDGPIIQAVCQPGQNPLDIARYFDPDGDTRKRVFGVNPPHEKYPFFYYTPDIFLTHGHHAIRGVARRSGIVCSVLHFKYFDTFVTRAREQYLRSRHFSYFDNWSDSLKHYYDAVKANDRLSVMGPKSIQYQGTAQLIRLGIIRSTPSFDTFAQGSSISPIKDHQEYVPPKNPRV